MGFTKGEPRPPNAGRKKGTPNKRTVDIRSTLYAAATEMGGLRGLVKWIKKDPINERLFWSQMYMKLLPRSIEGSGENGEIELTHKFTREEMLLKLEEHGLPTFVFGIEAPVLELEPQRRIEGDALSEPED
jgi:hypothetical protein